MNKKTLVSYFSATGTTENVAKKIARVIETDLFEIEPTEKYTSEDLNWMDKQSRSSIEMNDPLSRPKIKNKAENLDEYEKIIIGFPVWWYKAPTIINTFIEENDIENKEVYIFVTSGSSSVDSSLNNLRETYTNINFVSGKRLTENTTDSDIKNWLHF